jgi:hypothetical protein
MERRLVLAAGLIASLPVMVSVVRAIGFEWTATVDDGVIAVRSFDVLSAHPPLLGMASLTSGFTSEPTYNLGPMEFWLLALPARIGPTALIITMSMINTASILGSVALAERRGGRLLMFGVAAGIAVMSRSLPAEALYDILNPFAALFPFTLLLFLAWSVACGDHLLLPLVVVVASYVLHCHLTYLLPVIGIVGLALAGLAASRRQPSERSRPAERLRTTSRIGNGRRPPGWVAATVLIGLVCWSAPIADQAVHRPGNFVLVARAATADRTTLGTSAGWHAIARMVGFPPWWLRDARPPFRRLVDVLVKPAGFTLASTLSIVGGAILALLIAARRRRHDIVFAVALSLWLCVSLALVTRSAPSGVLGLGLMVYLLAWASPAGMWVWVTSAWAVAMLIAPGHRPAGPRMPVAALVGLGTVAAASAWTVSGPGVEVKRDYFKVVDATAERVSRALPDHQSVLIDAAPGFTTGDFLPAITYALRRKGTRVMVPEHYARQMGVLYYPGSRTYDWVVAITAGNERIGRGSHVIARFPQVTVTLAHSGP